MKEKETVLPDEDQCRAIMREHRMLDNIVDHSVQVMNVSLAICDSMRPGIRINRDLVLAAALLHDITKTRSIETGELRHDVSGGKLMREMGYPEIALIVESHVILENFNEPGPPEEREIVYYADKRVMHHRVVTIDERVEDLVVRYGRDENIISRIRENRAFIERLEKKLERHMRLGMEEALSEFMAGTAG